MCVVCWEKSREIVSGWMRWFPAWDEGNLLLLCQCCWKFAIAFDFEKFCVQLWVSRLQTHWQQGLLFLLRAVWCLISATRCWDSTLSCFWFKNIPLARQWYQGQELTMPMDSHPRCSGETALFMNINFFGVPQPARSQGMCNSAIAGGISLGCASPWLKRRSIFCQRIQLQFTPSVWVTIAEWHMVTRVEAQIRVVIFPSCRRNLAGLLFLHRLTTCHKSFLFLGKSIKKNCMSLLWSDTETGALLLPVIPKHVTVIQSQPIMHFVSLAKCWTFGVWLTLPSLFYHRQRGMWGANGKSELAIVQV